VEVMAEFERLKNFPLFIINREKYNVKSVFFSNVFRICSRLSGPFYISHEKFFVSEIKFCFIFSENVIKPKGGCFCILSLHSSL
jgi:hypothetical protein